MDAGLGGRMELHMVELYSILDFEWMVCLSLNNRWIRCWLC